MLLQGGRRVVGTTHRGPLQQPVPRPEGGIALGGSVTREGVAAVTAETRPLVTGTGAADTADEGDRTVETVAARPIECTAEGPVTTGEGLIQTVRRYLYHLLSTQSTALR